MPAELRLFLYFAPQARPPELFNPIRHHHRFTPSPYRHVCRPGRPQFDFYFDTRIPAATCPLWAFADVFALNLDFFRPTLYMWHVGIPNSPDCSAPSSEICDVKSEIPPAPVLPSEICNLRAEISSALGASTADLSFACLLSAYFDQLRRFPSGWTEVPPWNLFLDLPREEIEKV
jgi:hypothetical protein